MVPALTTWEQFLSTESRSRRAMVTVQPLGVDTHEGGWAAVLLANVARWYRDNLGVRRQNQPLDVWVARLGREGADARQRAPDPEVLTAAVTCEDGGFQVVRLTLEDAALTPARWRRCWRARPCARWPRRAGMACSRRWWWTAPLKSTARGRPIC
ncbi:hypothetical protein ACLEPN_06865 [Myxococcus sp. 1LA]